MKTNKITATIVIEIEDNRTLADRCKHPINKESVLKTHILRKGAQFISNNVISFEETYPLTDDDIKLNQQIQDSYSAIERSHDRLLDIMNLSQAAKFGRLIREWNWRQDCSN